MGTAVMQRVEDCISFMVGKAAQQVTRRARELLAPFGVTPVQYAVLKVLSDAEALSGAEIGKRMVLDSASITGVVDRLESIGLVRRMPNPNDRRALLIAATGEARRILPEMDRQMDRLNEEAAAILKTDENRFFTELRRIGEWSRNV
ncbi:MAG: MarR family transcriptional regulator [Phyllobacteriaceae bacterium]|nr:MarR family transcriptional regulator [Phyllobacteriaceae bacterium]